MDVAPGRASSSAKWGFTLYWRLPGLASCHNADPCFLIGVGLLLHQAQWRHRRRLSNCRSSPFPGRGTWKVGKGPSPHGRMDWWLSSEPLAACAWKAMPVASRLRLPSRTTLPRRTPLVPSLNNSSALVGRWRSARSSFVYRRQSWRCKR
jgi:hypothetical protein